MTPRIAELAARVRDLERQAADAVRALNQALRDLDAACTDHFSMPAGVPAVDAPAWHPPAMDSDEVEARAAERRPLPDGVIRRGSP